MVLEPIYEQEFLSEPAIDIPAKDFGSVRDRRLEVARRAGALDQCSGAGQGTLRHCHIEQVEAESLPLAEEPSH
jgi:hypothetical protein